MRVRRRSSWCLALVGALVVSGAVYATTAGIPARAGVAIPTQPGTGSMTYYNDAGFGACGTTIDAATQDLVAVSFEYWTTANPNADPLCDGVSVQVTYNGRTITVPVKDKCPSCDATHIDLSQTAFAKLAPLELGVVHGITWSFVTGSPATPSTAATATATATPTATATATATATPTASSLLSSPRS